MPSGRKTKSGQQYRHSHLWFLPFAFANDALKGAFVSRLIALDSPGNGPHVLCRNQGGKETHTFQWPHEHEVGNCLLSKMLRRASVPAGGRAGPKRLRHQAESSLIPVQGDSLPFHH